MPDLKEITLAAPNRVHSLEDLVEHVTRVALTPIYEDETTFLDHRTLDVIATLADVESLAKALREELLMKYRLRHEEA